MRSADESPFDNIENAQEYIRLLVDAVLEAKEEIELSVRQADQTNTNRRLEALRLVQYKLDRLEQHLRICGRALNDLRSLRRLLQEEREDSQAIDLPPAANQ